MSEAEAKKLSRIRALHAAIAPGRHALAFDGEGALLIADGPKGEKFEIARFAAIASSDEREFLAGAAEAVGFLLGLLDRAARRIRAISPPVGEMGGSPEGGAVPQTSHSVAPPSALPGGASQRSRPSFEPPTRGEIGSGTREANYAAEAAIKCTEPAFKAFLMERHGLERPASDERTAQRLRSLLGVTSRAELNLDATAAARWKQLRGEFEAWKRAGR